MRAKRPTLVITFPTTTAALSWERHCMEKNIPGRLSELEGLPYPALFEMAL